MAMAAAKPIAFASANIAAKSFSTASRASTLRTATRPGVAPKINASARLAFRRAYADQAPKPKPGAIRRTFRWVWRLSYLSVGGLLGYTTWVIYQDRHPQPQYEADPSKKTLVILGEL